MQAEEDRHSSQSESWNRRRRSRDPHIGRKDQIAPLSVADYKCSLLENRKTSSAQSEI